MHFYYPLAKPQQFSLPFEGKKRHKVLCSYLESTSHHFRRLSLLVLPNEAVEIPRAWNSQRRGGDWSSTMMICDWLSKQWLIFSVDLTGESYWKRHVSFMCLPSVIGSPANDLEQTGIPMSEDCALSASSSPCLILMETRTGRIIFVLDLVLGT